MKLKDMNVNELKAMSFTDIAFLILGEEKKKYNTAQLFKKICDLLEYTEDEYSNKIGDFYTSLTTDCRFIILDNAEWDLKDKHIVKETIDEDEDEEIITDEEIINDEELITEEDEENIDNVDQDEDLEDIDDDLEDLAIVEDEEV